MTREELQKYIPLMIEKAKEAQKNSYAPFSHFHVGASVLAEDGTIFTGTNVEPPVMNLGICAERLAVYKGISEGYRKFAAVCVVGPTGKALPPCGACRQILFDFGVEWVIMPYEGGILIKSIKELLPGAFSEDMIETWEGHGS